LTLKKGETFPKIIIFLKGKKRIGCGKELEIGSSWSIEEVEEEKKKEVLTNLEHIKETKKINVVLKSRANNYGFVAQCKKKLD
jgi:hypothetical protein